MDYLKSPQTLSMTAAPDRETAWGGDFELVMQMSMLVTCTVTNNMKLSGMKRRDQKR
jgi:hypothetical protein